MRKKTERKKQGLFDSLERYNINKNRDIVPNSVDATLFFLIGILAVLFGDSACDLVRCDGGATAAIISAAAAAASSIGSGIMMGAKKRGTTRMMEVSKQMAKFNNDIAVANWERENAYNSPAAQMQRYKEAGLNPNLIYGQQNTGGAIQSGQATTDAGELTKNDDRYAQMLQRISGAAGVYQQILQAKANLNNTEAATISTLEDTALKSAQRVHQEIDNKYFSTMMDHQIEGLVLKNAQNAFNLEQDRIFKARERTWDIQEKIARVNESDASADLKRRQTRFYDDQLRELNQSIEESKARINSLSHNIAIGYGNLGVAQRNAAVAERNAATGEYNAATARSNQIRENEKWKVSKPVQEMSAAYNIYRLTGNWPTGMSVGSKGMFTLNNLLDRIPLIPTVGASTNANRW